MNPDHVATLLKDSTKSCVCHVPREGLPHLLAPASAAGLAVRRIDLKGVRSKEALLDRVSSALSFPEWFGRNWDAAADCLGDLSWLPAPGYVLTLEKSEELRTHRGEEFSIAIEVAAAAASLWRERRVPFWVLLDAPVVGVPAIVDIR